jgi:hypothetical protein
MQKYIHKLGFYSALISFLAVMGYCIVQILQVSGAIVYPLDDILIYSFSLCIATPYLLSILALHYSVAEEKKIWSHAALIFALMYTIFVTIMYTVQLATVIPQSMQSKAPGILTVTPHSFFWTLDALGYICMGISTFFAAFVFENKNFQKIIRIFFIANAAIVPLISVAYFYPHFSVALLFIGSPWMITAPGSILLLALFFKKQM